LVTLGDIFTIKPRGHIAQRNQHTQEILVHKILVETRQPYRVEFINMLKEKLPKLCASAFEPEATPLFPKDFDFELRRNISRQDKPAVDIVVSLELPDASKLRPSDIEDAELIRDLVVILLDNLGYYLDVVGPRVGVALIYDGKEQGWVEGTIANVTRQSRREVMDLVKYHG
jgi:hypothetical protein